MNWKALVLALGMISLPAVSHAYIGAGLGVVDEDKFGYGLSVGASLPLNLGIEFQMIGYFDTGTPAPVPGGTIDNYWVQGNLNLFYDFHWLWKKVTTVIDLHPFIKGGFTYGGTFVDAGGSVSSEVAHGPGFSFGGGVDWKLLSFLTVGVELAESVVYLGGVTVGPVTFPDETAQLFNAMGFVKFFAY